MMDASDRLVVEQLAADLLEAEAVIARVEHKHRIAREMVSVLLEEHHDLTKRLRTTSDQLFDLREQFYGLRKQVDDARRRA